jgi:hypothetical protein
MPVVLSCLMMACGGGSDTPSSTAPVISNLRVSPPAVYNTTDPLTFTSVFDFYDADANIATLTLRVRDESDGSVVDLGTDPIDGVLGAVSGTVVGEFMASGVAPGSYTVLINMTDRSNLVSNVLEASVRIAAYPWTSQLADPIAREHAASAVLDGKLYVVGGQITNSGTTPGPATSTLAIFDPATNAWSIANPMPTARMGLTLTAHNGRLYAIGGTTAGYSTDAVGTVEIYDPLTNLWTSGNPMFVARAFAAASLTSTPVGNLIIVAGGEAADGGILADVAAYNLDTQAWIGRTPMPTARKGLAMAVANGRLYAVGGYGGLLSQWVGSVEEYNPLLDTWAPRAAMPTARTHLTLAAIHGQLLAAGGENLNRSLDVLESYDPVANTWSGKTASQTAFTRATAGVVDDRLWVVGNGLSLRYDPSNEIR